MRRFRVIIPAPELWNWSVRTTIGQLEPFRIVSTEARPTQLSSRSSRRTGAHPHLAHGCGGERRILLPRAAGMLALSVILLGACSEDVAAPDSRVARPQLIVPLCVEGCQSQDPSPTSPGYFLGPGANPANCIGADYWPDTDQDNLGDGCESQLLVAFAPLLKYDGSDFTLREPHAAARWTVTDETVRLMYMISYYRDMGSVDPYCTYNWGWPWPTCDGHLGDSEWISEDVSYDFTTQHWVLIRAEYSQHDGTRVYAPTGGNPYPGLQYPTKAGGYPASWVAIGKHANYATVTECNDSFSDYCSGSPVTARVNTGANVNIGSRAHHSSGQDCMVATSTSHPFYGSGKKECYWTGANFTGWYPDSIPGDRSTTAYGPKLASQGF